MIKKTSACTVRHRHCLHRRARPAGRHQAHAAAKGRVSGRLRQSCTAIAEIRARRRAGRHTHPGIEIGYVMEGEVDLMVEGQPAQHLKAGDS